MLWRGDILARTARLTAFQLPVGFFTVYVDILRFVSLFVEWRPARSQVRRIGSSVTDVTLKLQP